MLQPKIILRTSGKSTGLFGGKIDVKYKDEYNFTGRILYADGSI